MGRTAIRRGGRVIVAGFLIAAAAVIVFAAVLSASGGRGASYVVAGRALPAGTVIAPGDTTTVKINLPGGVRGVSFRSGAMVVGRTLAVAAEPGQLIESTMLAAPGTAGLRPVSVAVDPDSLGSVGTGELVDVLATQSGPGPGTGGSGAGVSVVIRGATLLAVESGGSSLLPGSSSGTVVTLGVATLAEAEDVIQAAHSGTVDLIQAEPSDGSGTGPGPGGAGG